MPKVPILEGVLVALGLLALSACSAPPANPASPTSTSLPPTSAAVEPASCTVESGLIPTAGPTEVALYPPPGKGDWTLGPADALVTIIEYGDYQ